MINNHILDPEFLKNAPVARRHLNSIREGTMDGLDKLFHIIKNRFPRCGAIDFDAHGMITDTIIHDGETLADFLSTVQETNNQLEYSSSVQPNLLLKQMFEQLALTNQSPLLAQKHHDFTTFRRNNPGVEYTSETVETVIEYLMNGDTSQVLVLNNPTSLSGRPIRNPSDKPSTEHQRNYQRFRKRSPNSNPVYTAMSSELPPIVENEPDDKSEITVTEDEQAFIDDLITPMFHSLKIDGDDDKNDELYHNLFFKAITEYRQQNKKYCEVCQAYHQGGRDGCHARGKAFQDEALQKRVEQCNAQYGDKPINPSQPRIPPAPKFRPNSNDARRPRYNAMTVPFKSPKPKVTFDLPDSPTNMQVPKYHAMSSIDGVLDNIMSEIEHDCESSNSLPPPKLKVLNLGNDGDTDTRSVADAMQVGDYDVYSGQVNC